MSHPVALGYGIKPAGDVSSVIDTSRVLSGCQRNTSRSFGYDFLDRLTDSPYWLSYGYDYGANLSAVGTYDASGKTVTQAVCFRHDPLGRMTSFGYTSAASVGPDSTSCTRDADVTQPLARFKYEARGRRIARQDAATGQWTYVVSDPSGNPLSEVALVGGSWTRVRDYVWLDGRPLAQVEYPTSSTAFAYYLHLDDLGRLRAMSNLSGQLVWNTFAKPYGDLAEKTATDPLSGRVVVTNLRLPGQYDERLFQAAGIAMQGPYYNGARWYLPGVGRYLELDPLALMGGFNGGNGPDWYNYVNGNPLRYIDRFGMAYSGGPATPGSGGDLASCSAYDEECARKNYVCPSNSDPYPCQAGKCCRKFDESDEARCARKCLIEEEQDCQYSGNRWICRMKAHYKCYSECGFYGSSANVSWSCIRTALAF